MKPSLLLCIAGIIVCFVFAQTTSAQHLLQSNNKAKIIGPYAINFGELAKYNRAHPKAARYKRFIEQGEDREEKFKFKPGPVTGPAFNFDVTIPQQGHRENSPLPSIVFNGTQDNGTLVPPDIDGAAGDNYVFETNNQEFDIYNKNGIINSSLSIPDFFAPANGNGYFDPHVTYDASHKRFIVISDGMTAGSDGAIFIGVSQTGDPTGNWYIYAIDDGVNSNTVFLDYPLFGFNNKWVVITGNLFGGNGGSEIFVLNRSNLYSGTASTVHTFTNTSLFSLCPATTNDTTVTTEYMVMDWNGDSTSHGYVRTYTLTGAVNTPVFAPGFFIGVNQPWSESFFGAPQLGDPNTIEDGDTRISNAVYINGSLWFAHTVSLPASFPTHDAVDWWQINPVTPTVQQFGRIEDPNELIYYYYPSISVNNAGNTLVGYAVSSPSIYASAEYSYRAATDALNTLQAGYVFKNGLASYYVTGGGTRNRWGDFTGTCTDPIDNSFWTLQEFSAIPQDSWGTVIANLGGIPCSGTPNAGVASATSTIVCPGEGTALSLNGFTSGLIGIKFLWQQSSNGINGWTNIVGNDTTTQCLTSSVNAKTYFHCVETCTNSGKSDTTVAVVVNMNGIFSGLADTVCPAGIHKIVSHGGGQIHWYLNNVTSTVLASGDTLTANILKDTTFYVTSGTISRYSVGPTTNGIGAGANFNIFTRGEVFTALSNFTIDSVFIYPASAGNVQVNITNALTGTIISSVTVAVSAAAVGKKTPIRLNMNVTGGTTYNIDANGSTVTNLFRNTAGAVYPYSVPGVLSITNNLANALGYYYFFYDWRIHTGCISIRTPVNVHINPIHIAVTASPDSVCSGSSAILTPSGAITYVWQPGNQSTNTISVSPVINSTYTVTGTSASGCTGSASVSIKVIPKVTPVISINTSTTTICAGTNATFTATPTNGGTTPSYQWKVNGVNAGTNSNTFSSTSLTNNAIVTCVLTSNLSCVTTATATSNGITMTVTQPVTPSVGINGNPATICAGTNATFTATPTNGGTTPSYQWKVNGVNAGTNSNTFSSTSLTNNAIVTCVLTSNLSCVTTPTATSNGVTMTVTQPVTPSVSISTNPTTICTGTNATFTATPANGGTTPSYQWKVNGANAGTNSNTFSSTSLANNAIVTCVLTSNLSCVTTATATSNGITMTVTQPVTPSVSISTNPTTICAGTNATFTATPTNGGTTPAYQWKVNGVNAGTNSNTFSSTSLGNNAIVTCVLTSNLTCLTTATATSNSVTMTVTQPVTPSVSISTNPTTICTGTNATFTATPTNGGTTPAYQWKVNGVNTGTNSNTFSSASLANNAIVTCVVTTNLSCVTSVTATSNSVTMTVTQPATPEVTINTGAITICAGTNATFTAIPTNGGTIPAYEWKVNGINEGTNSNTFSSNSLTDGDAVSCVLTSDLSCLTQPTATSGTITMTVNSVLTPAISIATGKTTICAGTNVTFTAAPTNGGATPTYQWKVNGINAGNNSGSFSSTSFNNDDIVTCVLTSSLSCAIPAIATSNSDTMTVNSIPATPIASANSPLCEGNMLQLSTRNSTNATFSWTGPNNFTSVTQNPVINNILIVDSGTYKVAITINNCTSEEGTVSVVINADPSVPVITETGNIFLSSSSTGNQWYVNHNPISGATQQTDTAAQTGWYTVVVTNGQNCSSTSDSLYFIFTSLENISQGNFIKIVPDPFSTQFNINISANAGELNSWSINITDELGRIVYENFNVQHDNEVDLGNKASGVYFVNILTGSDTKTLKVIKQ